MFSPLGGSQQDTKRTGDRRNRNTFTQTEIFLQRRKRRRKVGTHIFYSEAYTGICPG